MMKNIGNLFFNIVMAFILSVASVISFNMIHVYAETAVTNEVELQEAINRNESVSITNSFTITATIIVPEGYNGTISGSNDTTLTLGAPTVENMFSIAGGATVTFDQITFDGMGNGRIFNVSDVTLTIKNSTLKNATTQNFNPVIGTDGFNAQSYQGGAIYADGSTLNIEETTFVNNHTKNDTPHQLVVDGKQGNPIAPHGGAIYIGSQTKLNIIGGEFKNNYSGSGSPHGEGGAIKAEGGSHININLEGTARTVFEGNHNYQTDSSIGGLQGGALEITGSTVNINNADFVVKGGFDTGGAIKFESSGSEANHNIIKNSTFKLIGGDLPQIPVVSKYFGTSGGAIVSQDSYLTIDNSDFTMENNPNVSFAGGHIDVVGGGEFNLLNSRLKGNAPDWMAWNEVWKYKSAKYGGAIAFENKASVKALIKDTEIKNYMVDHTGGVISVGHRNGNEYGKTTVDLTIEGSTIHNGQAYTFDNNSAGAGIYISEGSKVVIKESENNVTIISQMLANYGAAIYNKGELTIDGGTKIINNRAEQMAGGLFNDGYANINNASFSGNWKQNKWGPTEIHTIGKDPREKSGENVYAKKDVIIGSKATFDGKDIRVIDKQSSVILSGPRDSVINVSISEEPKTGDNTLWEKDFFETATRHVGYLVGRGLLDSDLTASYKPQGTTNYIPTKEDAKKFHFVSRTTNANDIADVNDHTIVGKWDYVLDPEANNIVLGQRAKMIYHSNTGEFADASTEKEQIYTIYSSVAPWTDISQMTPWNESDNPARTNFTFIGWYNHNANGAEDANPITDEEIIRNKDANKFDFGLKFTNSTQPIGDIVVPHILHAYAGWAAEMRIVVTKEWDDAENIEGLRPSSIELTLTPSKGDSKTVTVNGDVNQKVWTYTFDGLLKFDEKNQPITYSVSETRVNNYEEPVISEITYNPEKTEGTLTIRNTRKPEYVTISAKKIWNDNHNQDGNRPNEIELLLKQVTPATNTPIIERKTVSGTGDQWSTSFKPVLKYKDGVLAVYEVDETDIQGGYTKTVQGYTITNSYTPQEKSITIEKIWDDNNNQDGFRPRMISVDVFAGADLVKTVNISEQDRWTTTINGLPAFKSGKEIAYRVKEKAIDKYTSTVEEKTTGQFKITNKHKPEKVNLTIKKVWDDGNDADKLRPEKITVELLKDGVKTGEIVEIGSAEQWRHTFDNLDKYLQGKVIDYSVVETEVNGYKTTYSPIQQGAITITNKHVVKPKPSTPPKKPENNKPKWTCADEGKTWDEQKQACVAFGRFTSPKTGVK